MSAELTDIVNSISRAANTLVEFEIFACLTDDREGSDRVAQRRVEDRCRELLEAANRLALTLCTRTAFQLEQRLPVQLTGGVEELSEGMRILARYPQESQGEIERAARLVSSGYDGIDKALRTVVEIAAIPVEIFLPKHARMHHQRALLLASLAERFAARLAAHASH